MGDTARRIGGGCTIDGKTVGLTGVHAVVALNRWPVYQLEVAVGATKSAGADSVGASTIASQLGAWQNKIVKSKLEVGFSVSVDGERVANVEGFAADVGMAVSVGNLRASVTMLPEYAKMDALNLSIYLPGLADGDIDDLVEKQLKAARKAVTYIDLIKKLTDYLMSDEVYERAIMHATASKETMGIMTACHSMNKEVVKYFYALLSNSDIDLGVGALQDRGVSFIGPLSTMLLSTLTRYNGSFLSTLCSLANLGRGVYVPGKDNNPGKLVSKLIFLEGAGGGNGFPVVQFNGVAANSHNFPIGCVYTCVDHSLNQDLDGELPDGYKVGHIAGVKTDDFGGSGSVKRILRISPPPWFPSEVNVIDSVGNGNGIQTVGTKPSKAKERVVDEYKQRKEKGINWSDVLKKWCYYEFCDQVLGPSVMAITSYEHKIICGDRINEDVGSGVVCCTDMLLTFGRGGSASARTTYHCTHTAYAGGVISYLKGS